MIYPMQKTDEWIKNYKLDEWARGRYQNDMANQIQKSQSFQTLHRSGGFVLPNAWDAGSAVLLAEAGFPAIGTTSAGIAFSLGKPDYDVRDARLAVSREQMFERIRQIVD